MICREPQTPQPEIDKQGNPTKNLGMIGKTCEGTLRETNISHMQHQLLVVLHVCALAVLPSFLQTTQPPTGNTIQSSVSSTAIAASARRYENQQKRTP